VEPTDSVFYAPSVSDNRTWAPFDTIPALISKYPMIKDFEPASTCVFVSSRDCPVRGDQIPVLKKWIRGWGGKPWVGADEKGYWFVSEPGLDGQRIAAEFRESIEGGKILGVQPEFVYIEAAEIRERWNDYHQVTIPAINFAHPH